MARDLSVLPTVNIALTVSPVILLVRGVLGEDLLILISLARCPGRSGLGFVNIAEIEFTSRDSRVQASCRA